MARRNAKQQGVSLDIHQADCGHLQGLQDDAFDALVSIYVLQDLRDLEGALAAFHRVLVPGGHAVVVFGHPFFFASPTYENEGVTFRLTRPYLEGYECQETWTGRHHQNNEPVHFSEPFTYFHRPLSRYWRAARDAGFSVEDLVEPHTPEPIEGVDERRWGWFPWSLMLELRAT